MQNLYRNTESQFIEFNRIIPYSKNSLDVYSPYLVSILQGIGPQIYGMFKIIVSLLSLNPSDDKFPTYVTILDGNKLLSNQGVILQENTQLRNPFRENEINYSWWNTYNKVKHELPDGIYDTKLEHIIDSLGALYILHHIADTIMKCKSTAKPDDVMNASNWLYVFTRDQYVYYNTETARHSTLMETFQSGVFTISKRFLPHLKNHKITPYHPNSNEKT